MNILGVRIDKVNMNEAVERAKIYLADENFHMIFTPNPEMIMNANQDEEFKTILNSSSSFAFIIISGLGVNII